MKKNYNLDTIDHIAIQVKNIEKSVEWYKSKFKCKVIYLDKTWAFIEFKNTKLALVTNTEHPPHFAVLNNDVQNNPKSHNSSRWVNFNIHKKTMITITLS